MNGSRLSIFLRYAKNYFRSLFLCAGICLTFLLALLMIFSASGKALMSFDSFLSIVAAFYVVLAASLLPSQYVFAQREHRLPLWYRRVLYSLYSITVCMLSMIFLSGIDSLRENMFVYIVICTVLDIVFTVIAFIIIDNIERRRLRIINEALNKINK